MTIDFPAHMAGYGVLDRLVDTARDYERGSGKQRRRNRFRVNLTKAAGL